MAKNRNGEGSIIRREDEFYVGRFYMETPDGNRSKRCSRCGLLE
jgi:hypothetical protein